MAEVLAGVSRIINEQVSPGFQGRDLCFPVFRNGMSAP
jgi:hypothetical protein